MTLSHCASTRVTLVSLLAAALLFGLLPLARSQQSRAVDPVRLADGRISIYALPYTITTCGSSGQAHSMEGLSSRNRRKAG